MHFQHKRTVKFRLNGDVLSVTRQHNGWTVTWRGDTASGEQVEHALATLTFKTRAATRGLASRLMRARAGDEVGPA
ncbi:MAG: hypothetical protein WAU41_15695 [Gaiellaceae bacterium]